MSCYLRHLEEVLKDAGMDPTSMDRKKVDRAIHRIVGVEHKNCPEAWKAVKAELQRDKADFVLRLRREMEQSIS